MNVITGQNNAGKTALLQSLGLEFERHEHRSIQSVPVQGTGIPSASVLDFNLTISGSELSEISNEIPDLRFSVPRTDGHGQPDFVSGETQPPFQTKEKLEALWKWLVKRDSITFSLRREAAHDSVRIDPRTVPSHNLYKVGPNRGNDVQSLVRIVDMLRQVSYTQSYSPIPQDLGVAISQYLIRRIYRFSAERFGLGDSPFGATQILKPDASNLAEVLMTLQSNAVKYAEYIDHVNYVLPQVKWISVKPEPNQSYRIYVWNNPKESKRDDIAIPLVESGTGIGQVLSILYVAFTYNTSRVLLIDEPQSFLHPGAARKLIEVLKLLPQHQYIISTHSSAILSAADADQVLIVRNDNGSSQVQVAKAKESSTLEMTLREVGARLSDVFGMDRILWVEGPTEEKVFPKLIARLLHRKAAGTAVVGIRNTGDLEGSDAKKIFEIYRNLSGKASVLPPALAFIMDSETRTDEQIKELIKLSNDTLYPLPMRTVENYLLSARAIQAVISGIEGFSEDQAVTEEDICTFLSDARRDKKYFAPLQTPSDEQSQRVKINGAKVLEGLFTKFSATRVSYKKTSHSVELFEWMIENEPESLAPLSEFLKKVLDLAECHRES